MGDGAALPIRRVDRRPTLAIVDASDGSGDLVGLIGAIRQRSPDARVVLAGNFRHPDGLRQPLAWADGLVQLDARPEVLTASLDLIMMGEAVLPTTLTGLLIERARTSETIGAGQRAGFDDQRFVDLQIRRLSGTEKVVLGCLKEGITNKIIARRLDLTVSAVTVAMKGILRKLAVQNRTQAALWALENLPNDRRSGAP
ncbi:MAG: response regulator transcription factor [Microvirga sp.]